MGFEADINESNAYYLEHDLCLVTKRPTPINVVKVDYTHGAKITQAYFETQSTTDYNGVYQGHYLDFEAKSTQSKTSFPLHNIPAAANRSPKTGTSPWWNRLLYHQLLRDWPNLYPRGERRHRFL
jgi:recombination protein U